MSETLVVRLSGRGQYEIVTDKEVLLAELNDLDNEIVALLTRTESALQMLLEQMATLVEVHCAPLQDTVMPSDLILPPTDLTLAEAIKLFKGEGLIPSQAQDRP
ncbi:MAG: hypothetical protein ACETWR_08460 [Anaerolineae bacterium]|jgi:hypothetical protein